MRDLVSRRLGLGCHSVYGLYVLTRAETGWPALCIRDWLNPRSSGLSQRRCVPSARPRFPPRSLLCSSSLVAAAWPRFLCARVSKKGNRCGTCGARHREDCPLFSFVPFRFFYPSPPFVRRSGTMLIYCATARPIRAL